MTETNVALKILSGGAAEGLVAALARDFKAQTGLGIDGSFGAVGVQRDKFLAGEAADLLILTGPIIADFAARGLIDADTVTDIGVVKTGVAVRAADPMPPLTSAEDLRNALLAAVAIYIPDPERATAGIHFAKVLTTLGIADEVAARLKTFPNGATAMRAMAMAADTNPIGCTQVTEILGTAGVTLAGPLPTGLELETLYTAAVCGGSANADAALCLIEMLTGADAAGLRAHIGFEDAVS